MLKSRLKSSPLLIKLFISFTIIITVSLSITGIISDKTLLSYAEKELSVTFIKNLEVADQIFGMWSENTQKQALNIAISDNIRLINECRNFNHIIKGRSSYRLAEGLFGELNTAISLNGHLSSIVLFPEEANYVVSSGSGIKLKTEHSDTPWITEHIAGHYGLTPYVHSYGADYVISFLYPLAMYQTPVKGHIIVNIKESALSGLINGGTTSRDGNICILNSEGDMLSNTDRSLLGKNYAKESWFSQVCASEKQSGYFKIKNGQEELLITYYKSNPDGLVYISNYSLSHLTDQVNDQRTLVVGMILLIAAAGILVSYGISKLLYSPIRSLTSKIERYGQKPAGKNEIVFLSDTFEDIIRQVEKGKADSFENDLLRLLNGTSGKDRGLLMNRFSPGSFCCILIRLDTRHEEQLEMTAEELTQYFSFISECGKTVFSNFYFCEGVNINRLEFALILNFNEVYIKQIQPSVKEIQEEFRQAFDFTFSAGIGGIQESGSELYKSYRQAGMALQKRLICGYQCIIEYEEDSITPDMYYFPVELEKSIENNLSACNYDKLESSVMALVENVRDNQAISIDNIYQVFNQIIGLAIKYLIENHINTQTIFANHSNLYQELGQCETLDELQAFTLDVFQQIINYVTSNASGKNSRVEYICTYIHENYHQDINLNDLAESAGISVSHMRRIFSEETGTNILYYINSLRINKSKELLQNTNLSISEIASKVGYFNNQSFNRFFKKYEGITPSEYRNAKWDAK